MAPKMRVVDRRVYPTMEHLLRVAERAPKGGWGQANDQVGRNQHWAESGFWYGTKDLREALQLARLGWKEGRQKIRTDLAEIIPEKSRLRIDFQTEYDVTGAAVDVGEYVAGVPEDMLNFPDMIRSGRGRALEICVNLGHACYNCASTDCSWSNGVECMYKGIAMVSLFKSFERQGFMLEVFGLMAATQDGTDVRTLTFPIRRADEMWDWDKAAFCLMHASMMRRIMYSAFHQEYGVISGTHVDVYSGSDIYIPSSREQFKSAEQAGAWVERCVHEAMTTGVVKG